MGAPNAVHTLLNTVQFDDNGNLGVVQHSHPHNINLHLHLTAVTVSQDFVLVDISDTANYKHSGTTYAHIENIWFHIDASNTADYSVTVGFVEDVTASAATFYHLYTVSGDKIAGQSKDVVLPIYPNGANMTSTRVVTNDTLTDAGLASTATLASTLDPSTANINPANGDLILRVTMNAGEIALAINMSYHGH